MKKTILEGVFPQEGKPLAEEQLSHTAKAPYEAPVTIRTLVETEGSFCGSVIEDKPENSDVNTTNQGVQTDYYDEQGNNPFDFKEDSWD